MKILLSDLDVIKQRRPFPNLALMKLSAYHKARGDEVYLNFPLCLPDIEYASCVFSWNKGEISRLQSGANVGGSGIDIRVELPFEIEHIMPDYILYPKVDFSLGFTSRGCIRRCPWCIVPEKEGRIKAWARIYEFWDCQHKKVLLLDNNLLAAPNWQQTMDDLITEELEVDFYQGLDIRLVNEDNVGYIKRMKAKKLRFAFDDLAYEKAIRKGLRLLLNAGIPARKLSFYLLVGFNGDKTTLERAEILKSYNVEIYPMIYKGLNGKEPKLEPIILNLSGYHGSWHNLRKFQRVVTRHRDRGTILRDCG